MSEGAQNLQQLIQQQTMQSVRDFYGNSLGGAKAQLQDTRTQLESLAEQTPQEEAQAEIQEMVDSYYEIESRIDQAAQDHGVEDVVNQATQQTDGQVTEQAGQAVQGAQDAAGGVAGQAGQAAQQAQDTAGQAAGQAQETVGGAAQQGAGGQQQGGSGQQQQPNATQAAAQKAEQLGVDLSQVEGSGSGGRITVKDVTSAASQG